MSCHRRFCFGRIANSQTGIPATIFETPCHRTYMNSSKLWWMVMFSPCGSCCRQGSWQHQAADLLSLVRVVVRWQAGVNPNAPLDSNHMTALMISSMMGNWDRQRPERLTRSSFDVKSRYAGHASHTNIRKHISGRILFNYLLKTSKLTWMARCLVQDVPDTFRFAPTWVVHLFLQDYAPSTMLAPLARTFR